MRIRNSLQIILLAITALALTIGDRPVTAQISSSLFGRVVDNHGSSLPGVTVTLTGPSGSPMVVVSNAQGQFRFLGLPPGEYSAKALLEGFSTVDVSGINLSVGRNTDLSITLTPADDEVISVTNEAPIIDAITRANNDPGSDTIVLNAPRSGPNYNPATDTFTINVTTPLPTITDDLVVYNSSVNPRIELNGTNLGPNAECFDVFNSGLYLTGVEMKSFHIAMSLRGTSGGSVITNCEFANNGEGVSINGAPDTGIFNSIFSRNGIGININNVNTGMTWIQNNYIGTDLTGRKIDPDGVPGSGDETGNDEGIRVLNSSGVMVGGTNPGEGNVVGGNGDGMSIINSNKITVQASYFGTNAFGDKLPNRGAAIGLAGNSSDNKIGGGVFSAGNVIAFNGFGIVGFPGTLRNLFLFNQIFENNGPGIDLNFPDGVTVNDPGDVDGGANGSQNFPVLTSADASPADTIIRGTLNSTRNTSFRIQYFANPASSETRLGQGKNPLGSRDVMTDANGNANADVRIPVPLPGVTVITALATNIISGDTSEFSPGVVTQGTGRPDLAVTKSGPATASCNDSITYTITVTNVGTAAAVGVNILDAIPECVEVHDATTTLGTTLDFFDSVLTSVPRLDPGPGNAVTITVKVTLSRDCGEEIVNEVSAFTDSDSNVSNNNASVTTKVDCVKIERFVVNGKDVFVQGTGFKKGDIIEINGEQRKAKVIDENTIKVKKGAKSLLDCDPANPDRKNVITLRRPDASGGTPILDTAAFATCP